MTKPKPVAKKQASKQAEPGTHQLCVRFTPSNWEKIESEVKRTGLKAGAIVNMKLTVAFANDEAGK